MSLTLPTLGYAFFIALAFAGWPILGKYSQATGAWVNVFILIASTLGGILMTGSQLKTSLPPLKAIGILVLAGLINGVAVYYYAMKAADPLIPTGRFLMTVTMLSVVLSPLLSWAIHGETLSFVHILGVGFAITAIVLFAM